VKQTDGAVGYVEEAYALQNNFTTADVKNRSGRYVEPTLQTTSAAGENIAVPADLGFSAIDSPNPAAYPIVSQTFIDVHRDVCRGGMSPTGARALKAFLTYALGDGQQVAQKLFYAPLPAPLLAKAKAQVSKLQCNRSAL
jgi:phosphate transport system substrate-binding protein